MQEQTHINRSPRSFACDLATLCAPTLAGLKPASLFRYQPAPGQDAAAMAAAWDAALSPRGVAVRILKQCPRTALCSSMYIARRGSPHYWQTPAHWRFWQGRATPPAMPIPCWASCRRGFAVMRISRMRLAFFSAIRWRMSSVLSATAAKTLRPAAIGRATPTPPRRRPSLTVTKSASASMRAAITTAPPSDG